MALRYIRDTREARLRRQAASGMPRRLLPLVKVRLFTKPPYVAGPHPWADKFVPRHLSDGFGPFVYGDPLANQFEGSFLIGFVCKKFRTIRGFPSESKVVTRMFHPAGILMRRNCRRRFRSAASADRRDVGRNGASYSSEVVRLSRHLPDCVPLEGHRDLLRRQQRRTAFEGVPASILPTGASSYIDPHLGGLGG